MRPLLLLDEVVAHLDPGRRRALFEALGELGAQVWMTGADPQAFADIADACADRRRRARPHREPHLKFPRSRGVAFAHPGTDATVRLCPSDAENKLGHTGWDMGHDREKNRP